MVVIITGPDLAGKSSITKKLTEVLPGRYVKGNRIADSKELYLSVVDDLYKMQSTVGTLIFDRWNYPEDLIYEPIMTGEESSLLPHVKMIERELNEAGALIIVLTADIKVLEQRYQQRGDEYISEETLTIINDKYMDFVKKTTVATAVIDTSSFSVPASAAMVLRAISEHIPKYMERRNNSDKISNYPTFSLPVSQQE